VATMFMRTIYNVTFVSTVPVCFNWHLLYHCNVLQESSWGNSFKWTKIHLLLLNVLIKLNQGQFIN